MRPRALARRLAGLAAAAGLLSLLQAFTGVNTVQAAGCLPGWNVPLVVQIGEDPPVRALLEGGSGTPLSLFNAEDGRLLWSAGAAEHVAQVFAGMDAPIFGSLAAIDLDADGRHDRIYAGDTAGRVWRLDLHHGAPASHWATGGMLGDFSNAEGRGFFAPPDLSVSSVPGVNPWLNVALGTAAPGNPRADNRFYVLREPLLVDSAQSATEPWAPVTEADLHEAPATLQGIDAAKSTDPSGPGWYVRLGAGHVVAPALTVDHRATVVIAEAIPGNGPCEVFVRIAHLDLRNAQLVAVGLEGTAFTPLPRAVPVTATLQHAGAASDGTAPCHLDNQRIPGCDVDTRPRRTWWRRMDAE
jgi:hypothetical protein